MPFPCIISYRGHYTRTVRFAGAAREKTIGNAQKFQDIRQKLLIRRTMAKILIIEDNQDIRYNLVDFLEAKGYQTDNTDDGLKALALLTLQRFDIIVLDIMLPGMDGISLCRELRARGDDTPVLFLSAKDTVADRIEGLSTGADDYLVKPFSLAELELRIAAILRRGKRPASHILHVADIIMNLDELTVTRAGVPVKLNPMMFRILKKLMLKSPSVVSRDEMEHELWGDDRPDSDSLRTHIHNLRTVIDTPFEKQLVKTVPGFGWTLRE